MLGFRVWDTHRKEMDYHDAYTEEPIVVMGLDGNILLPYALREAPNNFIPMQSTGLRCQKTIGGGDFIYEKDVVKVKIPDLSHEYVVIVDSIPFFYSKLPWSDVKFIIETMGNLFENPELRAVGATC